MSISALAVSILLASDSVAARGVQGPCPHQVQESFDEYRWIKMGAPVRMGLVGALEPDAVFSWQRNSQWLNEHAPSIVVAPEKSTIYLFVQESACKISKTYYHLKVKPNGHRL